ncbi:MAG: T9SS type A sorting domain-containing protein [Rhodothermales bacterium]|nr:T9SS type A sorting domain-containing protein [Rhodothermales bacterium]
MKTLPNLSRRSVYFLCAFVVATTVAAGVQAGWIRYESFTWNEVNEAAEWQPRAGLQAVELRGKLFVLGGRTPISPAINPVPGASTIWGDVWKSRDRGKSWKQILDTNDEDHWPARAYFQAVTKGPFMYVLGGQNFDIVDNPACPQFPTDCPPKIPQSEFFNDVWRSHDGVRWKEMTSDAGWEGRAGLSSIVFRNSIYVMGGSKNDDSSIVGDEGPARVYFNDVWKSRNGRDWKLVTEEAPWAKRAGAVVVKKNGWMYLLGGEDGFICDPLPLCEPPYFNDVWRSRDGAEWELVTPEAGWSARPGHQCVVYQNDIVCFGGFGLLSNPMDVWVSRTGEDWRQVSDSPWNAVSPTEIKYDFDALVVKGGRTWRSSWWSNSSWNRHRRFQRSGRTYRAPAIFTFGGDRETFDFADTTNYRNVDNDVWSFGPTSRRYYDEGEAIADGWTLEQQEDVGFEQATLEMSIAPNPTYGQASITYTLEEAQDVELAVYDMTGRLVRKLETRTAPAGQHTVRWDGNDEGGLHVADGVYLTVLRTGSAVKTESVVVVR